MVKIPDEMLMAYADGELAREQAHALEALLRDDAALRARLAPFVVTGDPLAKVFEARLAEPIPERLIATITHTQPLRADARRSRPAKDRLGEMLGAVAATLFPHGVSLATAASVALLVSAGALGGWLAGQSSAPSQAGLIETAGPGLVAGGVLAQTLETAPSRTLADAPGAAVVPVLSFRTGNGDVCRQYRARGAAEGPDYAGLACRTPEGIWRVTLHVEAAKAVQGAPGTAYQTATEAPRVPAVEAHVDTMIAGDALGSDEEAALLANGWQQPTPH